MIIRNVDVNNLERFDFFNDTKDTLSYLRQMDRLEEAKILEAAYDEYDRVRWARYRETHCFCGKETA